MQMKFWMNGFRLFVPGFVPGWALGSRPQQRVSSPNRLAIRADAARKAREKKKDAAKPKSLYGR